MFHLAEWRGAWIIDERARGKASAAALRRSMVRDSMARVEGGGWRWRRVKEEKEA
jgi:hypothetical protein